MPDSNLDFLDIILSGDFQAIKQEKINFSSSLNFIAACITGNVEIVEYFVAQGANINQFYDQKHSPLFYGLLSKSKTLVDWMIDNNAEFNQDELNDIATLHHAFDLRNSRLINKIILNTSIDIHVLSNSKDLTGMSIIHLAIKLNYEQAVLQLVKKCSSKILTEVTANGLTPSHIAIQNGHIQLTQLLLEIICRDNDIADILLAKTSLGMTILHFATILGNQELLGLIIKIKPELLTMGYTNGCLPLHFAVLKRNISTVSFLLTAMLQHDAKAIVRPANNTRIALHMAVLLKQEEIVKRIIAISPLSLTITDNEKCTALHLSIMANNLNLINVLLTATKEQGQDITQLTVNDGSTLLHMAAKLKNPAIGKTFVEHDKKLLAATDSTGRTALFIAVEKSNDELTKFLLDEMKKLSPASIDAQDKSGETALHKAANYNFYNSVKLLTQEASQLTLIASLNKVMPLHIALQKGCKAVAEILLKTMLQHTSEFITHQLGDGSTFLHCAAKGGLSSTVDSLVLIKPELLTMPMNDGKIPLESALISKQDDTAKRLLEVMETRALAIPDSIINLTIQYDFKSAMLMSWKIKNKSRINRDAASILLATAANYGALDCFFCLSALGANITQTINDKTLLSILKENIKKNTDNITFKMQTRLNKLELMQQSIKELQTLKIKQISKYGYTKLGKLLEDHSAKLKTNKLEAKNTVKSDVSLQPELPLAKTIAITYKKITQKFGHSYQALSKMNLRNLATNYPLTPKSLQTFREKLHTRQINDNEVTQEIEQAIELKLKKFLNQPELTQLMKAKKSLYDTLSQMDFDFLTATSCDIQKNAFFSTKARKTHEISEAYGLGALIEQRGEHYFVFGFWLPRGTSYPYILNDMLNLNIYIFDGRKLIANLGDALACKANDPFLYRYSHINNGYLHGKIYYTQIISGQNEESGLSKKLSIFIAPQGNTKAYIHKEIDQYFLGTQIPRGIALDVIEMIEYIEASDQASVHLLLEPFTDEYIKLHGRVEAEKQQKHRATKLYLQLGLREATVIQQLPLDLLTEIRYSAVDISQVEKLFDAIARNNYHEVVNLIKLNKNEESYTHPNISGAQCVKFHDIINVKHKLSTPLIHAITHINDNEINIVRFLLENGANVNAKRSTDTFCADHYCGTDALMVASKLGHLEVVKLLLEYGANIAAVSSEYLRTADNALTLAEKNNQPAIVDYLIRQGVRYPDGTPPNYCLDTDSVTYILKNMNNLLIFMFRAQADDAGSVPFSINFNAVIKQLKIEINQDRDVRTDKKLQYDAERLLLQSLGIKGRLEYDPNPYKEGYSEITYDLGKNVYKLAGGNSVKGRVFYNLNAILAAMLKTSLQLILAGECFGDQNLDPKVQLRPAIDKTGGEAPATSYLNTHDTILASLAIDDLFVCINQNQLEIIPHNQTQTEIIFSMLKKALKLETTNILSCLQDAHQKKLTANLDQFVLQIQRTAVNYLGVLLNVENENKFLLFERWHPHINQSLGYTGPGGSAPFPHNINASLISIFQWKLGINFDIAKLLANKCVLSTNAGDLAIVSVNIPREYADRILNKTYMVYHAFYNPQNIILVNLAEMRNIKLNTLVHQQFIPLCKNYELQIESILNQMKLLAEFSPIQVKIPVFDFQNNQFSKNFAKICLTVEKELLTELQQTLSDIFSTENYHIEIENNNLLISADPADFMTQCEHALESSFSKLIF